MTETFVETRPLGVVGFGTNALDQNGHTLARWNSFVSNWRKAYGDRNWLTGY